MEIILLNDGCTDGSPDIINAYAAKDESIVMLSSARNAGLSIAKGEYLFFVDNDDTVCDDTVETLCRQAVSTGADVVIGNTWFCYPDWKQVPYHCFRSMAAFCKKHLLPGVQCFSQLMEYFIFVPLIYQYFTNRYFIKSEIDTTLLAEKIIYLLQNNELRNTMGQNACKCYDERYSEVKFRQNMMNFYTSHCLDNLSHEK